MPDTIRPIDGGLGEPAKRGRPRKIEPNSSIGDGGEKPSGGNAEPVSGIESAATAAERIPSGFVPIDPLNPPDNGSNGDRPRRGRKPGGKNRPKEEAVQNLSGLLKLERLLVTGCFFLGNIASAPELYLEESEAAEISEALKELSRHYPIGMSEKTIAWVNFSFAVGGVFGPKVMAISKRPKPQRVPTPIREAPKAQGPSNDAPHGMVNGLANPVTGVGEGLETAKVPSQMWNQPGDIEDVD